MPNTSSLKETSNLKYNKLKQKSFLIAYFGKFSQFSESSLKVQVFFFCPTPKHATKNNWTVHYVLKDCDYINTCKLDISECRGKRWHLKHRLAGADHFYTLWLGFLLRSISVSISQCRVLTKWENVPEAECADSEWVHPLI